MHAHRGSRKLIPVLRRTAQLILIAAATWWLFADTIARYRPTENPNQIRFAHFGSHEDYTLWRKLIDAFETANPTITIKQEFIPGWYGRYDSKIRRQILSKTLPDIVLMQLAPYRRLAPHFQPIDDLADAIGLENFAPTAIQAFQFKSEKSKRAPTHTTNQSEPRPSGSGFASKRKPTPNKPNAQETPHTRDNTLHALPVSGGNLLIYLNLDCYEEAVRRGRILNPSPPDDWTMTDFQQLAEAMTYDENNDGRLDRFGFWRPRWLYYIPFIWSFDARLTNDATTTWQLIGPNAEHAFDFYRELAATRRVCPKPSDLPQIIQDVGFLSGKVGMCVNGPWFQPFLAKTRLRDRYIVMTIPTGPNGIRATRITWDGLCISGTRGQAAQRNARAFVRFCLSSEAQGIIARTGRALPALNESLPEFLGQPTDDRRTSFITALSYARLQPDWPEFVRVDRAIGRHLEKWIGEPEHVDAHAFLGALAEDDAIRESFEP